MRPVIAGIDLTVLGRRTADRARLIAESVGSPLHLIHVLESPREAMIRPELAKLMRQHQSDQAHAVLDWIEERAEVPTSLTVAHGSAAWDLAAKSKNAELLVVGSSSIDAFRAGPVARRVARKAQVDTLIVKRQPRVPYRRVVVGVDFSEPSRQAVDRALTLFGDADITVAFALPSRFDAMLADAGLFQEEVAASRSARLGMANDHMDDFASSWDDRVRTVVLDGPPMEALAELVRRRNADLVIAANRGATATRMVLLGNVVEGLIGDSPCDVMVARIPFAFRRP